MDVQLCQLYATLPIIKGFILRYCGFFLGLLQICLNPCSSLSNENSRFVGSVLDVYWELPPVVGPSLTHQTRYDPARASSPIVDDDSGMQRGFCNPMLELRTSMQRGIRKRNRAGAVIHICLLMQTWRCVWHMIQNDMVHGWGLDFALRRCVEISED
ncbi:uncharacterized protein LOC107873444 isoform X5 [Capsicum annuum]|uniref:uncharacterized protein LOC107873444 isoform X5 n=1 Tax=Capsicum annuum TaxID=4072 RepID=UPI001FB09D77|nr:uncharacterized protein LOC107873444 isoform X5 [Capsicum annuum]